MRAISSTSGPQVPVSYSKPIIQVFFDVLLSRSTPCIAWTCYGALTDATKLLPLMPSLLSNENILPPNLHRELRNLESHLGQPEAAIDGQDQFSVWALGKKINFRSLAVYPSNITHLFDGPVYIISEVYLNYLTSSDVEKGDFLFPLDEFDQSSILTHIAAVFRLSKGQSRVDFIDIAVKLDRSNSWGEPISEVFLQYYSSLRRVWRSHIYVCSLTKERLYLVPEVVALRLHTSRVAILMHTTTPLGDNKAQKRLLTELTEYLEQKSLHKSRCVCTETQALENSEFLLKYRVGEREKVFPYRAERWEEELFNILGFLGSQIEINRYSTRYEWVSERKPTNLSKASLERFTY